MSTTHRIALGDAHEETGDVGVEQAEKFARRHPRVVEFSRVGWVAKGLVYGLTGVLALLIGIHAARTSSTSGDDEASQTGAIARIAEHFLRGRPVARGGGRTAVYSLWRLVSVLLPADNDVKGWLTRLAYVISAIIYLALAATAITFVSDPGRRDDTEDH